MDILRQMARARNPKFSVVSSSLFVTSRLQNFHHSQWFADDIIAQQPTFSNGDNVVRPTSGAAQINHFVSNPGSDCINSNHSMQRTMEGHQVLCYLVKKCEKWRKWCSNDMVDMVVHVTQRVAQKHPHTTTNHK